MQEFRGNETSKPHSYEAIKIEVLDSPMAASLIRSVNVGQNESDTKEFTRISISGAKLLNNVEKSKDFGKNLCIFAPKKNMPNIYEFPDVKKIVVCGDIHGDFKALVYKCCVQYQMTDTLIVVAGDCGFGFQRTNYYQDLNMQLSGRLSEANNWLVFVRGNHDNPAYFDGKQVNYERWKAVPDYSVIKACGHTILCVGGAISIDRTWRITEMYGMTVVTEEDRRLEVSYYWPDEKPVYDEAMLETISETCIIDTIVTHTAPSFCERLSRANIQDWLVKDEDLLADLKDERRTMDRLLSFLKEHGHPLKHWYYGHFHESWHSEIDGVRYNMLDCMELREL